MTGAIVSHRSHYNTYELARLSAQSVAAIRNRDSCPVPVASASFKATNRIVAIDFLIYIPVCDCVCPVPVVSASFKATNRIVAIEFLIHIHVCDCVCEL